MKLSIYVAGGSNLADVSLVSVAAVVDKFDRGGSPRWMKTNNSAISSNSLTIHLLAMSVSFGRCPRSRLPYHWFIPLTSSSLFLLHYLVGWVTPGVSPTPATRQIFAGRFGKARVGTITCECTKHELYVYIPYHCVFVELSRSNLSSSGRARHCYRTAIVSQSKIEE